MYFVYVLKSAKGKHYIGSTKDLERRLIEHNCNNVSSTKNRGSFKVVYKEEFKTRTEARKRENQLKGYKNTACLNKIIEKSSTLSSSLV